MCEADALSGAAKAGDMRIEAKDMAVVSPHGLEQAVSVKESVVEQG
jgi:hypothetical protein